MGLFHVTCRMCHNSITWMHLQSMSGNWRFDTLIYSLGLSEFNFCHSACPVAINTTPLDYKKTSPQSGTKHTLQGTITYPPGQVGKIISKRPLKGDILVPRRVDQYSKINLLLISLMWNLARCVNHTGSTNPVAMTARTHQERLRT